MRALAAVVVMLISVGAPARADDAESEALASSMRFDWPMPDDFGTYSSTCETEACKHDRGWCKTIDDYMHHFYNGTNLVMICRALGVYVLGVDLESDVSAEILRECTSDPQGTECKSIGPMCARNRDEGWAVSMIEVTCKDATKAGASWDTSASTTQEITSTEPNEKLDRPFYDVWGIERACAQEGCPQDREVCQQYVDATGGYIVESFLSAQCRATGVNAPDRDLLDFELERVQAWCPRDPSGPACTSLQRACDVAEDVGRIDGYPNLATACEVMASVHPGQNAQVAEPAAKTPKPPTPGITDLWYGLAVGRVAEPALLDDTSTTIAADLEIHGLTGLKTVAPAIMVRGAVGSTTSAGLLYDLALAFGVGLRIGGDGMLAVTAGGGLGGITGGRLGFAWQVPIDAYAAIPIGASLRVVLGARGAWLFKETARQDGATSATIFDEVQARVGVAVRRSKGVLLGLYGFASEARETRILGLALVFGQVLVETGVKK